MKNINKSEILKEKLKIALNSTARAISDELINKPDQKNINESKKLDFLNLENLNSKNDFIRARAESDSLALKKKFSNEKIFRNNSPSNSSCKSLYSIAEKIRYELLGCKMLKGIETNLLKNYTQNIQSKRKGQIKKKDDILISEAFELYMLKKFYGIKLNTITNEMLSFWEKDFNQVIEKHINFLKENLEFQKTYSAKFSEILQQMEIFQNEDNYENKEVNQDNDQNNPSNDNQDNENEDKKDQNKEDEAQASLDSDYDIDKYKLDDQLLEVSDDQPNSEQVIQKKNISDLNTEYKIFTHQFDEITKAENLEDSEESLKLRKTLDQQLVGFQDIITKLANKLQRQLLAIQNRTWEFDLEEGLLDSSKLPRIIMDPYNSW